MTTRKRNIHPVAAVLATGIAGLALAGTANAVDLRDWGRKFATSERFVVLSQFNNQAVLDKETQLVWQRTPSPTRLTWGEAKGACFVSALAGRRGWRLPSLHEMSSLADPSVANGALALPAGHPFQAVPIGSYWTATRHVYSSQSTADGTYYINLGGGGFPGATGVSNALAYYLCVRGGGATGEY